MDCVITPPPSISKPLSPVICVTWTHWNSTFKILRPATRKFVFHIPDYNGTKAFNKLSYQNEILYD